MSIGSSHAVNAALYPKLPYAPAAGFSAIVHALRMRDVHELQVRQGMDPAGSTPAEFDVYLRSEIAKWTRVVREAGIRAE